MGGIESQVTKSLCRRGRQDYAVKCFFVKAYPELDFRYFSKSYACVFSINAQYHAIQYGALDLFDTVSKSLCSCKRFFKSVVVPMYFEESFKLFRI